VAAGSSKFLSAASDMRKSESRHADTRGKRPSPAQLAPSMQPTATIPQSSRAAAQI
jgi:hypothetical protein